MIRVRAGISFALTEAMDEGHCGLPTEELIPGLGKPDEESDFYFVPADGPETAVMRIVELVKSRIPKRFGLDPIRDIQVLCPMNRGGVGARSLNIELQKALNPAGERKVERFGWTFAPGDKVMQILSHPLISHDRERLIERPVLAQIFVKSRDEWTQTDLRHVGDQLVEHASLSE